MKGKEFGEIYTGLMDDDNNYEACITHLERINDQYTTEKSIEAIKQAQKKTKEKIDKFNNYKVIEE